MSSLVRKSLLALTALFALTAASAWGASIEPLSQGIDFLAQEAVEALADVPNGKFAVLQFVEEPADPTQSLRQPCETAGLGIQLSQRLTEELQKKGKQPINRTLLCTLLKQANFKVEDLGNVKRLAGLFGDDLSAIVYGRMRRDASGTVNIGVDLVKMGPKGEIIHYPQGRTITVGMSGDMYALCSMNGLLQVNAAVAVTPPAPEPAAEAATPAAPETPMLIVAPLQPQVPAPKEQPFNIEVIVDNAPLPCYKNYKGDFYVPAEIGKSYQVRLTNNTADHVAVSLLIDGLSAIGKQRALPVQGQNFALDVMPSVDTPSDVYKYIVAPKSVLTVTGWQIDDKISRDFGFGKASESVAGKKDFWDYIGGISASFYPIQSMPDAATLVTKPVDEREAGAKGLEIGTIEGDARRNQTVTVKTSYQPNPAAVLGLFYDSLAAINQAGMTLAK